MRAQLRTYHAIPSLQARQDPHAYKQLQDAPRLKSILKGGAEDRGEPGSLDELKHLKVPRTNPVNLLFLICQSASKVAELHFPPGREFHDLIMKTNYSSRSRARAFLWIMWFYLESDYTEEGCEENPFGPGVDYEVDVANQGVPRLEEMTPEQQEMENVDTQEEKEFGKTKQLMRAKIIEADQHYLQESQNKRGPRPRIFPAGDEASPSTGGILPRIRPSKHESDLDSVRSTPPPRTLARHSGALGSTARRGANPLKYQIFEGSSPGGHQPVEGIVARKPRPPTAHQIAVERNRTQRVEYILDRGLRRSHHKARKHRRVDGSIIRALNRLAHMPDPFEDSEDEECVNHNKSSLLMGSNIEPKAFPFRERGYGGLCQLKDETDDFGEEVSSFNAALRRAHRRLLRWEAHEGDDLGVIPPIKRPKVNGANHSENDEDGDGEGSPSKDHMVDPAETEDEAEVMVRQRQKKPGRGTKTNGVHRRHTNGDSHADEVDDLDEVDKELLGLGDGDGEVDGEIDGDGDGDGEEGEGDGEGEGEGEDELDEVDKTLLGMDGDSDSD